MDLTLQNIQVGDVIIFLNTQIKVVDFYTTGGPEQEITVVAKNGEKFDIWYSDAYTPIEN